MLYDTTLETDADPEFQIKPRGALGRHTRCWKTDADRRDAYRRDANARFHI
jgi:hypothetical protein